MRKLRNIAPVACLLWPDRARAPLPLSDEDVDFRLSFVAVSRKAEEYLIASGLTYTIIHPGGLLDKDGGKRRLVVDIDDAMLERKSRSIPRADVAQVCARMFFACRLFCWRRPHKQADGCGLLVRVKSTYFPTVRAFAVFLYLSPVSSAPQTGRGSTRP